MIKLQIVDSGRTGEQRVTMEGGELAEAEDEEERAEAGEVEKERAEAGEVEKEREVMAEDEEERAEAGEVEKETFQCSDCYKKYAFIHKLKSHQAWSCKGKEEVEKIKIDFARRPMSSNIFSVKSKEGDIVVSSVGKDKPVMVVLCLKLISDENKTFRTSDPAFAANFLKPKML